MGTRISELGSKDAPLFRRGCTIKTCNICKLSKDISNFHKKRVVKGVQKYFARCRDCRTIEQRDYRKTYNRLDQWRRWKKRKNILVTKAHRKVRYHLEKGNIKKLPCGICGEMKSMAHHDNYNFPLIIRWLCNLHHVEWHKNNKAVL